MFDWRDVSVPLLLLGALALTVAVAMVVAAGTSAATFSVYNSDWDGTSQLRSTAADLGMEVESISETTGYESSHPGETVAFVLSPDGSYRPQEAARVTGFVERGGTLVVAADTAEPANELLGALGASAQIDGRPVRDEQSNYRSASIPVATDVADRRFVAGVNSVTLNYGTVVRPGNATVLVNTSEYAYLDADRNGTLGNDETLGSRPVVTTERVGQGRVVVVGDSSVFINAMLDRSDNRRFVRVLLSDEEYLLLDYSHAPTLPPLAQATLAVRDSSALQFGLGVALLAALAVWSRRPGTGERVERLGKERFEAFEWGRKPWSGGRTPNGTATREELIAHLERRHPDWDPERVERVVSAVERRREGNDSAVEQREGTDSAVERREATENSRSNYPARRGRR